MFMIASLFKYLLNLSTPLIIIGCLSAKGPWSFLTILYVFGLIPLLEIILKPDTFNLDSLTENKFKDHPLFDLLIYLIVPLQIYCVYFFLETITTSNLSSFELVGLTASFGIGCGVLGINVGHELGHRKKWYEQVFSIILLGSSLYMHFFIEHNKGHHKHVASPKDPASAAKGENLYKFWFKTVVGSYISAWNIQKVELKRRDALFFSFANLMLIFHFLQFSLLTVVYYFYGLKALICFSIAALIGILLLETVNYIEHYGLRRQKTQSGYSKVLPCHSWNSDHPIGRILLFEVSRHSDHHYQAQRKYQVLRHFDNSPQMPYGYPAMILIACVPFLWFKIMHKHMESIEKMDLEKEQDL
mgnify:CR=1 FL=1